MLLHTFSGYLSMLSTYWIPAQLTNTSIVLNFLTVAFITLFTFELFVRSILKNNALEDLNFFLRF